MSSFSSSQHKSSQEIHNESYDSTHGMLNVMAVGNDSGTPVRLKVSSDGTLNVTGGGGGTEYIEDDAAAANPTGTSLILVRADTPAGVTSTNGDNVAQRGTDYGAAYVQLVDSSGNFIDSVGGGASATGGCDMHFDADGDNTAQQVKASAGTIYGISVSNPNTADAYLQLFDVANGSITVGTTTPNQSILIPAGNGTEDGARDLMLAAPGIAFGTAINYACTTTATGNTDPTTGLVVNILYK